MINLGPIIGLFIVLTILNFNTSKFILNILFHINNPTKVVDDRDKIGSAIEIN